MDGSVPSYDAVGRGIYLALRANPDCTFGERYARILKEGYPHYISEMASQILMLDKKDVDVAYLERKISYLKIFVLVEPGNAGLLLEIGQAYMDKGLSLSALRQTTASLYRAEEFLRKAIRLSPNEPIIRYRLGEVSYILGKYDDALAYWGGILDQYKSREGKDLAGRCEKIEAGIVPKVPVVDYLEAIGVAFDFHLNGEFAEAAGILYDVLEDPVFREEFPLPEVSYVLGLCCSGMGMPRYAEDYFREALRMNPDYEDARSALDNLAI
jgi:tetratricopeptide (TPR) repeat protein